MSKQKHSHSYHRYFENYAEKEVLLPGGGHTIQRVYVGKYYRADISDEQLRRQKKTVGLLFFGVLASYLAGALTAVVSAVPFVAICTMPPLVALLLLGISVFYRLTVPREMEIRAFRDSSDNLRRSSMGFILCIAVCFAATLVGCLIVPLFTLAETVPSLLFYLLSAVSAGKIYLTEKNTPYITLLPKHERPSESSPIRYEMPD